MKKMNFQSLKLIPKRSRHIIWNWEQSPDNPELARYHVVIADNKKRKATIERIFQQAQDNGFSVDIKRMVEGKVSNSGLRYLLASFDTSARIDLIDWTKTGKVARQERELYERKAGSIEKYVADSYGDIL